MGFDRDSELVPCHLLDGGKGEIEEKGGEGEEEEERSPGKFLKWIYLYFDQKPAEWKGGR